MRKTVTLIIAAMLLSLLYGCGSGKTRAVVFHDDLSAGIRVPCPYGDVQRI